MAYLKTKKEIEIMAQAGKISALGMREVAKAIKPGVTTLELDRLVEQVFLKNGAQAAFKRVSGYKYTICTTPNDWVVHGLPGDYKLKEGDIIGVDLGAYFQGYNSDMAETFPVGKVSKQAHDFLATGKLVLEEALKKVKAGNSVGDISSTIQKNIEGKGYSVVKELVGHGVGKELHENPMIPGRGKEGKGEILQKGMVIAVEIIYNQGKAGIVLLEDGWTIATKDGSLAGLFEKTIALTEEGPVVLTAE